MSQSAPIIEEYRKMQRTLLQYANYRVAFAHCAPLVGQIAIAWVLANDNDILPIPGAIRRKCLEQNAAAVELTLPADEIAPLSKAFPPDVTAGTRYLGNS